MSPESAPLPDGTWPPCDPATVAPLKDGRPHMYAHMPTRFVTRAEAEFRGWKYFYIGDVCIHGHKAPRFISNVRMCVDCDRIRDGKNTIGGKGAIEKYMGRPGSGEKGANKDRPTEPSKVEKDFLAAYAELKDFDSAAKKVGHSPAVIESRLAWSTPFRTAYDALEERCGMRHVPAAELDYDWDEDKRSMLIRVYVDTGDLATARDAIRVTNFEFNLELQRNPEFAAKLKEVEPLAHKLTEERGIQEALRGNDKLISMILRGRQPEVYGDKMKIDLNELEKQTPAQMISEILRLLPQLRDLTPRNTITVEAEVVEAPKQVEHKPETDEDINDLL